ncbi:MAG: hypothetical protein ABSD68_00995 [Candidatus Micrarchaeales archaeon]
MGKSAILSEAKASSIEEREKLTKPEINILRITRLESYAIDMPEVRQEVLSALEDYIASQGKGGSTAIAKVAVSVILAVSMLETLKGECTVS